MSILCQWLFKKRKANTIIPRGDTVFEVGDTVFFITSKEGVEKLQADRKNKTSIKNIMILGGGRIGLILQENYVRRNLSVYRKK